MSTDSKFSLEEAPKRPHLALLIYPGFSEFEVAVALTLLSGKFTVVNLGLTLDPVRGEGGLQVLPEQQLSTVRTDDFTAALIPGAPDLRPMVHVPELNMFLQDMHSEHKVIGAICGGPFALGQAGVLEGLPYTVSLTAAQRAFLGVFPESGFVYRDVVHSENIITAQGHAFAEFGLVFADALGAVDHIEAARRFYHGRGNAALENDPAVS